MRLISWNVNCRRDLQRLITVLDDRAPDLVALQEFNTNAFAQAADAFTALGLPHVLTNEQQVLANGRRNYGLLIASRWSLTPLTDPPCAVPWPETFLSARVDAPFGSVEVHTTHIPPGSSHGSIKVQTMQDIYNRLACASDLPRILCGDFNTPQIELADGTVLTWGQSATGALRRDRPGWDAIERSILLGLAAYDLPDVFRDLHGYSVDAWSWVARRKSQEWPRRFDHVFASRRLRAQHCRYLDGWRKSGLSDHAAIEVVFAPIEFTWAASDSPTNIV